MKQSWIGTHPVTRSEKNSWRPSLVNRSFHPQMTRSIPEKNTPRVSLLWKMLLLVWIQYLSESREFWYYCGDRAGRPQVKDHQNSSRSSTGETIKVSHQNQINLRPQFLATQIINTISLRISKDVDGLNFQKTWTIAKYQRSQSPWSNLTHSSFIEP